MTEPTVSEADDQSGTSQSGTTIHSMSNREQQNNTQAATLAGRRRVGLPDVEEAYSYGVFDGRLNVPPEYFVEYVHQTVEVEYTDAQTVILFRNRERAKDIAKLEATKGTAENTLQDTRRELEEIKTERKELTERRANMSRGSLFFGLLFTVVGVMFVVGDIVITKTTVADGLRIIDKPEILIDTTDAYGYPNMLAQFQERGESTAFYSTLQYLTAYEGTLFALALAFLSVLLKPVYDRLFEEPYLEATDEKSEAAEKSRTRMTGVQIGITALVVATLCCLGMYRTTVYQANQKMESLNRDLGKLRESKGIGVEQTRDSLEALYREANDSKTESGWMTPSFVLTGVLMAIAGAVCLGIGSKHLQYWYHHRFKAWMRANQVEWDRRIQTKNLKEVHTEIGGYKAEVARLKASDASPDSLAQGASAIDEELSILKRKYDARKKQLEAAYLDGHSRGQVELEMETEAARKQQTAFKPETTQGQTGSLQTGGDGQVEEDEQPEGLEMTPEDGGKKNLKWGRRPYRELRKQIRLTGGLDKPSAETEDDR